MQVFLFLASPGDVPKEREYVQQVVEEVNRTTAHDKGLTLIVKEWKEDTIPGYGKDAQAIINDQIAEMGRYHLFVGLMWNRLGTPTPRAESGTVEEFERADEARRKGGRPEIWFYFRDAAANLKTDEQLDQRKKALAFKKRVQSNGYARDYSTPADFRDQFRNHLTRWVNGLTASAPPPPPPLVPVPAPTAPRSWRPAVLYPLQPAPHFEGRAELLADLKAWATMPGVTNRVIALVAAGGTGKTAVAERVVAGLPGENAFGVFVWSFYENPQTEAFLRAACEYFLGEAPKETGGLLERLQTGLRSEGRPHLFVLDGLELVQATGTTSRPRGELEDPLIRRFLGWLAAGLGAQAKALITSRFPLPELEGWDGRGFKCHQLDDVDVEAARAILRKRGVKGGNVSLDAIAESVHRHALTLDVLGLYLARFHDGDPNKAPTFDITSAAMPNYKAARLQKVLASYATKLPSDERDLLARLSLFPKAATVHHLGHVVEAGGGVAGSLANYSPEQVTIMLERLCDLGLVFASTDSRSRAYTTHPFLRDFFRNLLGATKPEQVLEAVRTSLAPGLDLRPGTPPTNSAALDRIEHFLQFTVLSGRHSEAIDLYEKTLHGRHHLSTNLGEHERARRIVSQLLSCAPPKWHSDAHYRLARDLGIIQLTLGHTGPSLVLLSKCFFDINSITDEPQRRLYFAHGTFADCLCVAGRFSRLSQSIEHFQLVSRGYPEGRRGITLLVQSAADLFLGRYKDFHELRSTIYRLSAYCHYAPYDHLWHLASRKLSMLGYADEPSPSLDDHLDIIYKHHYFKNNRLSLYTKITYLWGRLAVGAPVSIDDISHVAGVATATGDAVLRAEIYCLAAFLHLRMRQFAQALSECRDGIYLSDSSEFGLYSIDLRNIAAEAYICNGHYHDAIRDAEAALIKSSDRDCLYAWGIADSLHLLGVAHGRLGDTAKARDYLTRAAEKRKALTHPGLADTEAELEKLR